MVILVEDAKAWLVLRQPKVLEEPGGVPKMPLGGAGVRHTLDDVVLDLQVRAQLQRPVADLPVTVSDVKHDLAY